MAHQLSVAFQATAVAAWGRVQRIPLRSLRQYYLHHAGAPCLEASDIGKVNSWDALHLQALVSCNWLDEVLQFGFGLTYIHMCVKCK